MNLSNLLSTAFLLAISSGTAACATPLEADSDQNEAVSELRNRGGKTGSPEGGRCGGGNPNNTCQAGLKCENIPGRSPVIADGIGKCVKVGAPEGGSCGGGRRGSFCQTGLACEDIPGRAPVAADGIGKCVKVGAPEGGSCGGGRRGSFCQTGLECENIPGQAPVAADGVGKCVKAGQPEGGRCGGLLGIACKTGLDCVDVPGEAPIAADGLGQCVTPTKLGTLCGTRGAVTCTGNQFCEFSVAAECGATDKGGACRELPRFCLAQFAPVIGCDDQSYSNACGAAAAGVSVKVPFGSK